MNPSRPAAPSVSVVFPAFNEEDNVLPSVEGAAAALDALGADYEIIVVNDCSTDDTGKVADELARRSRRLTVIHHDRNYKLGRTLRDGFAAARKDLVFYTDCDLPIDFADIGRGYELIRAGEADAVIGFRLDRGGESWVRAAYSFTYNRLVRLLFGLRVKDVNFSYKLVKREVLGRFTLTSDGSFIDAELLARLKASRAAIKEIGVHYRARRAGRSTLARPRVIAKILWEMGAFWLTAWRRAKASGGGPDV
jgi:glycosyltransferase involved in cell wall biosynthesis